MTTATRVRIPARTVRRGLLSAHYGTYQKAIQPRDTKANFVPGVGDPMSKVVIVGEAPGKEEDWQRKPFVGASGELLDTLLAHVGLERSELFITNIVKHRPIGNKLDQEVDQVLAAIALMRMELKILKPVVLVTMGVTATRLYWPNPSIGALAGTVYVKQNQLVVPLYHPSWGLRNRRNIPEMKEHMRCITDALGRNKKRRIAK